MRLFVKPAVLGLAAALLAGTTLAQDMPNPAIKARQSVMALRGFELGILGAMAKGDVPYDAEVAAKAAGNLVLLSQLDLSAMWPEGTDNSAASGTRALPDIWSNFDDVAAKAGILNEAALELQAAAGTDLESMKAAMGNLGAACTACHKAYRAPAS
ncbi:cytochrome c [Tropicimonas sp. IMCC6043]|uniref:c-type cytochrome n=1 Tax=Tropicimonas sp. IMCC6043 TaxID=2510645 RepID=UPI00101D17F7|nr:cytochrome c [Tropicimonas sp. IMCC6043]RYH06734.1 cytochrome c [Tropicimonas sp. IMCC6043]